MIGLDTFQDATSPTRTRAPESSLPGAAAKQARSNVVRVLYMGAGSVFVALGLAGMVLPLVPTTIFLILAAACYGRSSTRAYHWLTTNRFCGEYLRNYQEHRGITRRARIVSLTSLWLGIGATIVLVSTPMWVNFILLGIAVGVSWHLLTLTTIRTSA